MEIYTNTNTNIYILTEYIRSSVNIYIYIFIPTHVLNNLDFLMMIYCYLSHELLNLICTRLSR